ncbi:MAG TPA: hypothetical protein VF881_14850 [Polyangiaceae bacterium]
MRVDKWVTWMAIAAAAAMPLFAGGCGGSSVSVSDTHVGRGEPYHTGNFNYDEFFEDVYGLQGSAKNVAEEEKAARAPLGQALGTGETSMDRMLDVLKEKADELAQNKNRVHIAFDGVDGEGKPLAGKQITVSATAAKGRAVPKEATELAQGLEQTAQKEGQIWEKYGPVPEKGKKLADKADSLIGSLETEFATSRKEKREEIEHELKAAKQVSEDIGERCEKVVATATKFLKQSGEVVTAAANAEVKPAGKGSKGKAGKAAPAGKSKDKDKDKDKEKDAPKPKDAPKAAAAEKPAPPPKAPPPESGGDFNP